MFLRWLKFCDFNLWDFFQQVTTRVAKINDKIAVHVEWFVIFVYFSTIHFKFNLIRQLREWIQQESLTSKLQSTEILVIFTNRKCSPTTFHQSSNLKFWQHFCEISSHKISDRLVSDAFRFVLFFRPMTRFHCYHSSATMYCRCASRE